MKINIQNNKDILFLNNNINFPNKKFPFHNNKIYYNLVRIINKLKHS